MSGIGVIPYKLGTTQKITTGASSATGSAFGAQTYAIRVVATAAAHMHIAQPAVAATSSDPFISATQVGEIFRVSPGDIPTAIQDAAAGVLYITELTR